MIANTLEYLYANAQIMKIIDMIEKDCILDGLEPIKPSDVVNLSLDLLRIFIGIHHVPNEDYIFSNEYKSLSNEDNQGLIDNIREMSESEMAFLKYADKTIDSQRKNNETLQDVLLAIETIDDKELLINKILSKEILK